MDVAEAREATEIASTPSPASLARPWASGTGVALIAVTSIYVLAEGISGPLIVAGGGEVTLGNVIGFTVLGTIFGGLLAYVLGRFARRPRLTFLTATLTALAGYAVVPITAADSLSTAVWLNVLHVVVAVPVVGILVRHLPPNRASTGA